MSKQRAPLPVKNGVSPNRLWLPQGDWQTVLEFFRWRYPQLDSHICINRFNSGEVCFENGESVDTNSIYQPNRHLFFYHEIPDEVEVPFIEKIIYEDENILVADKPHFLPVAPSGNYLQHTLLVRLRRKFQNDQIQLCHRLDRETAGVVLLTKKESVRGVYQSLFSERKISKTYLAKAGTLKRQLPFRKNSRLVKGLPFMRMKEVDGHSNSETLISLEQSNQSLSLYKLQPETGKKHQLRVHMASLGSPIINDCLYPKMVSRDPHDFSNPLQLLAKQLEFVDPLSSANHCFTSEQQIHLD